MEWKSGGRGNVCVKAADDFESQTCILMEINSLIYTHVLDDKNSLKHAIKQASTPSSYKGFKNQHQVGYRNVRRYKLGA